jgi:hypothetical protein
VDPANCGGCGIECTGDQACQAGGCSDTCLDGTVICGNRCVDDKADSEHCGGCNDPCDPGMGCVDGGCQPMVGGDLDDGPGGCVGGGPPLDIGDGAGAVCTGDLAEVTFRWALCSCDGINLMNPLTTDAYSSASGGYQPGGLGGGVGVNGAFDSTSEVYVYGDLWASLEVPFQTSNPIQIWQELHAGGGVDSTGLATIGEDAYIDGDLLATNPWSIAEALFIPGTATVSDQVSYLERVNAAVSVPPPCDCGADELVPVADYVSWASANNHNDLIGLDPDLLNPVASPTRIDLPCGIYYLSAVDAMSPVVIAVHGRASLFIAGDLASISTLTIAVDSTAELNLFVAGTIATTDKLKVGSASYPALTRVYLGGSESLTLSNNTQIGAFIYAAYGLVETLNELNVFGGLYAGDFISTDDVWIHYDREVLVAGEDCSEPGDPGGATCDSCLDCGNQACVDGECGACTDSSACCAPLECVNGECISDNGGVD